MWDRTRAKENAAHAQSSLLSHGMRELILVSLDVWTTIYLSDCGYP
jgi:hypothetical protein